MARQPSWPEHDGAPPLRAPERAEVGDARTEAERMMQLGYPVAYTTVLALLRGLDEADAEIAWLRTDRKRWQEAYCEARLEARLEARRRDA